MPKIGDAIPWQRIMTDEERQAARIHRDSTLDLDALEMTVRVEEIWASTDNPTQRRALLQVFFRERAEEEMNQ